MSPRTKDRPYNVLFICTGNSARSIMAEAILNDLGRGLFRAFSAGSAPTHHVNPIVTTLLEGQGFPTGDVRSKSWDEFGRAGAPQMDFVFTLCDRAARENCPVWPGHPLTAHWGFEDPTTFGGSDAEKSRHFEKVFKEIAARIRLFLALPLDDIDSMSIRQQLRAMGREGPT